MKKTIIAAAALVAMAACNKSVIEMAPASYGTFSLGMSADTEIVATKADENGILTDTEAADYIVTLSGSNGWEKFYKNITEEDRTRPAGTYTLSACNISEAASVNGKGDMRLASEAQSVEIKAGQNTDVTISCKVVNSKVTVALADGFSSVFENVEIVLDPSARNLAMTAGDHSENADDAWFPVGEVNWQLTATVVSTDMTKVYTGSFDAEAAKWNKLTFSAGQNGTLTLKIQVDKTITENPVTEVIDPLSGTDAE